MDDFAEGASALQFAGDAGTLGVPLREGADAAAPVARQGRERQRFTLVFPPAAATFKRMLDVLLSAMALLLLAPLLLLVALLIRREGGPALFAQPRVGRNGRVFQCYKFRSMVPDAEHLLQELLQRDEQLRGEWQRAQKLRRDPRITRVGELLRRSSIDELPQLWNVLRGDMSLIGPRPILLHQLPLYGPLADCYIAMRPGITGLWQVTARGDGDFGRRIQLDCEYVRQFSIAGDLRILFKTIRVVLKSSGAY